MPLGRNPWLLLAGNEETGRRDTCKERQNSVSGFTGPLLTLSSAPLFTFGLAAQFGVPVLILSHPSILFELGYGHPVGDCAVLTQGALGDWLDEVGANVEGVGQSVLGHVLANDP